MPKGKMSSGQLHRMSREDGPKGGPTDLDFEWFVAAVGRDHVAEETTSADEEHADDSPHATVSRIREIMRPAVREELLRHGENPDRIILPAETDQTASTETSPSSSEPVDGAVAEKIGVRVIGHTPPEIGVPADSLIASGPSWYKEMVAKRAALEAAGVVPTDTQMKRGIFTGTGVPPEQQ